VAYSTIFFEGATLVTRKDSLILGDEMAHSVQASTNLMHFQTVHTEESATDKEQMNRMMSWSAFKDFWLKEKSGVA